MATIDQLHTTYTTIKDLYKKNTTETRSILDRIENELKDKGYTKVGDYFYRTRDLEKLTPIHKEPRSA